MRSRIGLWLQVLKQGAASVNSAVGWWGFLVLGLGIAAGVTVPQVVHHVSHWLTAVIVLAVILVVVLEGSYAVLKEKEKTAALESVRQQPSPVPPEHADALRRVANGLRYRLEGGEAIDGGGQDADMWRDALLKHFPALKAPLEKAAETGGAFERLRHRLYTEAVAAGMDASPWTAQRFLPRLARDIQTRALSDRLGSTIDFDWHPVVHWSPNPPARTHLSTFVDQDQDRDMYMGEVYDMGFGQVAGSGVQLLDGCKQDELVKRLAEFVAFFKRAESWPEAAAIGELQATKEAVRLLAAAANTDPITGRCNLCGLHGEAPGGAAGAAG